MGEYIKRSEVLDKMNSIVAEYLEDNSFQCNFAAGVVTHIKDDIAEIPAADVVEVKRGKCESKPIIRHCMNCKWDYHNTTWIIGNGLCTPTYNTKDCQVKYKRIKHQRLAALLCRYYTQKEGTDDERL